MERKLKISCEGCSLLPKCKKGQERVKEFRKMLEKVDNRV